jgi:hypothetical protein
VRLPVLLHGLRHRDFRFFWAGQSISLIGDGIFNVALVWQTLELSSTPAALTLVTLARFGPRLALLLVGGAVSDRVSRRRLMLTTDLIQGAGVGAIAVLAATSSLEIWHLAALSAVVGAANAFYLPTITAIVPELVPRDDLVNANALRAAAQLLTQDLIGPALGGILVATAGSDVAFAVDAVSFAVSFAALLAIRTRSRPERVAVRFWSHMSEGFFYAKSRRWLWISLVAAAFGNLFLTGSSMILIPLIVRNDLSGGATELGMYFASLGLGGGLGILLTSKLRMSQGRVPGAFGAWTVSAIALAGMGLSPSIAVVVVCGAVLGAALQYGNVMWETLLQEAVPQRILGRVTSFDWFVSLALQPASLALATPVALTFGSRSSVVAAGLLDVVVLVLGYSRPGVRDARPELEQADAPAPRDQVRRRRRGPPDGARSRRGRGSRRPPRR